MPLTTVRLGDSATSLATRRRSIPSLGSSAVRCPARRQQRAGEQPGCGAHLEHARTLGHLAEQRLDERREDALLAELVVVAVGEALSALQRRIDGHAEAVEQLLLLLAGRALAWIL